MMKKITSSLLTLAIAFSSAAYSQAITDTTALKMELGHIMAFADAPYVYYSTSMKMGSEPLLESADSASLPGVFYKNGSDIYYDNGLEQTYIQDSFLIQVNAHRKSIWINKVDIASKAKLATSLRGNSSGQEILKKSCQVQKVQLTQQLSRITLSAVQKKDSLHTITTSMGIDYLANELLPVSIDIQLHQQQLLTADALAELRAQPTGNSKLIQSIANKQYLVRMQSIHLSFFDITLSKEKAAEMPSWKAMLDYDPANQSFVAKGRYTNYEVTKIF